MRLKRLSRLGVTGFGTSGRFPSCAGAFRSIRSIANMDVFQHLCDVDAEPLHRYRPGGYHPVHLGDFLRDGRYKVLHKLGWGGYSTVWAARDESSQTNVAVKISVSEQVGRGRESSVLRTLAKTTTVHPGLKHLPSILDDFQVSGPNGTHECIVFEIVGPNVPDVVESRFKDERLSGKLAKNVSRQALLGVDCLHEIGITHGGSISRLKISVSMLTVSDLHTRNLAFAVPHLHKLSEETFLQHFEVETALIRSRDGKAVEPNLPKYLVRPLCISLDISPSLPTVKIIDFGEAFLKSDKPGTLHTPLVVRPPEVILNDEIDFRADLWSMGCMLFELVTGQPPFDSMMITPSSLLKQMLDTTGEQVPERWHAAWQAIMGEQDEPESEHSLQEWLEEVYFDEDRQTDLTREDILKVGGLVRAMLRLEPGDRASTQKILQDPWVQDG